MKIISSLILMLLLGLSYTQEIAPEITLERKKLIILASEKGDGKIADQITQIASSTAIQLNRYDVIDRSQLDKILKEQKLQHSGVVDQAQAVEIGNIAGANEALYIQITNFGQKGVPTEKQKEKEEEEKPDTGLFGWIVKEVVKAKIDKELEEVERYPNNIQTVIDGEVRLLNVETSQSIASFLFNAEHTGGVKSKSIKEALKQVRSQMVTNLKSMYQLKSEVLDVTGNEVMLLLGKDMGVREGTLFEISSLDQKRVVRDREITIPGKKIGLIEVNSVSADASEGRILSKRESIEPGYQAKEITEGIISFGLSGMYGNSPDNLRLRLLGNYKPFHSLGGSLYGDIGTVKDSRDSTDFQFGFGLDLNYRFIRTSPFSLGVVLSLPFDFNVRSDDGDKVPQNSDSHTVFLPVFSPRIGMKSEIMISPSLDIVIRGEYVLSSLGDKWSYTEESDDSDEYTSHDANWDDDIAPEIDYSGGVVFTFGIRSLFFDIFSN